MIERDVQILRDQFGEGKRGDAVYETIVFVHDVFLRMEKGEAVDPNDLETAFENTCSFRSETGELCGKLPTESADFDVIGDFDFALACSEEHARLLRRSIEQGVLSQGRYIVPGRNGFGRA